MMPGEVYFCPHFPESPPQCFFARLFNLFILKCVLLLQRFLSICSTFGVPGLLFRFFYPGSSLSSPRPTRLQPSDDDDGEKLVNSFSVEKKMGGRVPPKLNHGASVRLQGLFPQIDPPWNRLSLGGNLTEMLRGMNSTCSLPSRRCLINNAGSNGAERGLNSVPGRAGWSKVTLRKRKQREPLTQVVGGSVGGRQGWTDGRGRSPVSTILL